MTPTKLRIIGIVFLATAAVLAILNLQRVANLGMNSLVVILMILGIVFVVRAKKASKPK